MKTFKHYVGSNLKFLRRQKVMTLRALSEDMVKKGILINKSVLEAYENSRNAPHLAIAYDMSKYFGLTMEEFCFTNLDTEDKTNTKNQTA